MPDRPLLRPRLALFQPDIAGNVGTLARLAACLDVGLDIIEPCGFALGDKAFARAAMDYAGHVQLVRHVDWAAFAQWRHSAARRLVLLTTKASMAYTAFSFQPGDVLLVGQESAGVPDSVHSSADARVTIPLRPPMRSLNVALAAAMVLGEALRQTELFPA